VHATAPSLFPNLFPAAIFLQLSGGSIKVNTETGKRSGSREERKMRIPDDFRLPEIDEPEAGLSDIYQEYAENTLWELMFEELPLLPDSFPQGLT